MKIALFGYGKMGQLVEQVARAQGHQFAAIFSRSSCLPCEKKLSEADVAIDFSVGACVLEHLSLCLSRGKPLVIGTTGWEDQIAEARHLVLKNDGSCLHAPNFSIGVYLYRQVVKYAASLFHHFPEYDVCGIESHHKHKLDHPSGTAKAIRKDLLSHMPRLQSFDFTSIRCGHIPGTHSVHFEGAADSISFTHEARGRHSFAEGAVMAASWLLNRKGFYSFDEMMQDPGGEN